MPAAQHGPRTFVLIPGAGGAASWYWQLVAPLIRQAGHELITVDLPADDAEAGLPEYARLVADAVGNRNGAVLVAASLGGFTAPMVTVQRPVAGIVMVNAMIPAPGETPLAWSDNTGQPQAQRAAAERDGYSTEIDLDTYFLHDVSPEVFASGDGQHRDEAAAAFESPCEFTAWPDVPIRVVAGADDRLFPVEFQQRVARERLGIEADVLPGGHLIALAQPDALARYLLNA
ncbi:MAG: alpha/beta hydrolase [Actinobacteria bacterium]|nr:alpha/beta hydrolase [Actinomycetota bacterium]MBO0835825.1 alpha/beta hydrolase [Actinomycetota bacterium]